MQYGLGLPNMRLPAQTFAELAKLAEEAGWDGIFLEDYIVHWSAHDAPTHDPWILLAAMASRTRRIRLGTSVTALARRRPWKLAREAVTLDHLSNGRLILGVGLGDAKDPGFAHVGEAMDDRRRASITDEALDVLAGLWSGQPFSYHGNHFQIHDVTFLPTPVQKPRIPIWVGGTWPFKGPLRRAARWNGMLPYKHTDDGSWQDMTPEEVRELKAFIERERERAHSTPFDIVLGGRERGDDWEQERAHIREVAAAGATWWGEYIPPEALEDIQACIAHIKQGPLRG